MKKAGSSGDKEVSQMALGEGGKRGGGGRLASTSGGQKPIMGEEPMLLIWKAAN